MQAPVTPETTTLVFAAFIPIAEVLDQQPWDTLLAIAVVAALALTPLAIKLGTYVQDRRTRDLRARFGDEYDQAIDHHGDRRRAEAALIARVRAEQKHERESLMDRPQ